MSQNLEKAREDFFKDCEAVVKAPASFYWAGEFSDVYGYPALIQAIPLYAYVGIIRGYKERRIQMKNIKPRVNISVKSIVPSDFDYTYFTEKNKRYYFSLGGAYFDLGMMSSVDRYLEYYRHRTKQGDLSIKFWCGVPVGCGLNASAAIATALSCAVYLMEEDLENDSEIRDILKKGKDIKDSDFMTNKVFLKIFRRASIIEACLTGSIGSGAGIFAALLGGTTKDPLLYLSRRSGLPFSDDFVSIYRNSPLSIWSLAEADADKIDFCGRTLETILNDRYQLQGLPEVLITHSGGEPFRYGQLITLLKNWFRFDGKELNLLRAGLETPSGENNEQKLFKDDTFTKCQHAIEQPELPFVQILGSYSLKMLTALQSKEKFFTDVKTVMN